MATLARPGGWRGLLGFWALVLLLLGGGAAWLQVLGPPGGSLPWKVAAGDKVTARPAVPVPPEEVAAAREPLAPPPDVHSPVPARSQRPGSAVPGPIAAPDPGLLEPGPDGALLPRIGVDGRTPGQVYARGFTAAPGRPRIAIVLSGIGMNAAESAQAIASLPSELTLAMSPYAPQDTALLDQARRAGHELLLSVPMEPVGFPLNDPGEHALLTGATAEQNGRNLTWTLARFAGYAGVTSALGGPLNGERFPTLAEQIRPVLQELAARGLFYLDARIVPKPEAGAAPASLPYAWNRSLDLIVDDPADAAAIDAKLAALEGIARLNGSAVGLVGVPSPVALERLAIWTKGLPDRGFALAPASALMQAPGALSAGEPSE